GDGRLLAVDGAGGHAVRAVGHVCRGLSAGGADRAGADGGGGQAAAFAGTSPAGATVLCRAGAWLMNAGKGSSVGTVWFVGAGPGDPDLITVKGRRLLEQAGAILFAGSLVDQTATHHAPSGCEIRDSKDMTLEQMSV